MSQSNNKPWIAAVVGGVIGAALTAGGLVLAGPSLFGERLVRETLVANPEIMMDAGQALRDKQYAETLAPIRAALERFNGNLSAAARHLGVARNTLYRRMGCDF